MHVHWLHSNFSQFVFIFWISVQYTDSNVYLNVNFESFHLCQCTHYLDPHITRDAQTSILWARFLHQILCLPSPHFELSPLACQADGYTKHYTYLRDISHKVLDYASIRKSDGIWQALKNMVSFLCYKCVYKSSDACFCQKPLVHNNYTLEDSSLFNGSNLQTVPGWA